jgi:LPS export ABC transporter protein LptC
MKRHVWESALITGLLLVSCRNDISEIKAITDPHNYPVQTTHQAVYTFTEHGKVKNRLEAGTLERYAGEDTYLLASGGFMIIFYDSTEAEDARLTALNGRYEEASHRLVAWDKVELWNVKGEKLETEELIFSQDSSRIYTDRFVKITTLSGVIFGEGLESNDSFTRYRILRPTGDIYLKE